jgi:hypothetical protein
MRYRDRHGNEINADPATNFAELLSPILWFGWILRNARGRKGGSNG